MYKPPDMSLKFSDTKCTKLETALDPADIPARQSERRCDVLLATLANAKAPVNTAARLTLFVTGDGRHKAVPNLRLICRSKCLIFYNKSGGRRRRPRHLLCLRRPAIARQIESSAYNRRRPRDAIDKIEN